MKRLITKILATAVVATTAHAALAADYPDKPVRLIVPTAAGGSLDTLARLLGQRLEAQLGQPFVVENRPGGNGNTAFEYVSKAKPDGYTLLVASDALAINPSLYKNVRYDPVKGFAPISLVTTAAQVLVVKPSLNVKTLKDFTALVKQKGKAITVASPGSGSAGHLAGTLYQSEAGVTWTHVAYKGGGPAVADLVGGHVDGLFVTLAPAVPQVKAGALVALAVTTPKRSTALPDVPTVAEAGVPGFDVTNWQGVFAPAGTPAALVDKVNGAIQKIVREQDIKSRLIELGFEPVSGGPADLGQHVRENVTKWAKVIPQANITVD
ncbi:Bug family tripartite tricarboxylate transporter substrate binding protein [Uliginosibacterium sp. sgz301328]|uniref:Bug family tripartite tricarboxylate transporter substrate binding protein n=1 Tax=Uliginosibacterium sp. sgz301328 TaxID=3243764 RepID=UPI00359EEBE4